MHGFEVNSSGSGQESVEASSVESNELLGSTQGWDFVFAEYQSINESAVRFVNFKIVHVPKKHVMKIYVRAKIKLNRSLTSTLYSIVFISLISK